MLSVFGAGEAASAMPGRVAIAQSHPAQKRAPDQILVADIPLPPQRPLELAQAAGVATQAPLQEPGQETVRAAAEADGQAASELALVEITEAAPLPPHRPPNAVHRLARFALPKLITGAQPILPPDFSAYADMDR